MPRKIPRYRKNVQGAEPILKPRKRTWKVTALPDDIINPKMIRDDFTNTTLVLSTNYPPLILQVDNTLKELGFVCPP